MHEENVVDYVHTLNLAGPFVSSGIREYIELNAPGDLEKTAYCAVANMEHVFTH